MNFLNLINDDHLSASPAANLYENSPFKELRKLPPKTKGTRFEVIVEDVLTKMGYDVQPSGTSKYDFVIDGVKTEVKGATLSACFDGSFKFKFMQIRMDQPWEELLLVAFWPRDCRMFCLMKKDVQHYIDTGVFVPQHGGKDANNDTYIFIGDPAELELRYEIDTLVDNPKKGVLVA